MLLLCQENHTQQNLQDLVENQEVLQSVEHPELTGKWGVGQKGRNLYQPLVVGESWQDRRKRLRNANVKKWADKNREYLIRKSKERRIKYHEKYINKSRESYHRNKEKRNAAYKIWYSKNDRSEYRKKYYDTHKNDIGFISTSRVNGSRRRARDRGAQIGDKEIDKIISKWRKETDFECSYCKKVFPTTKLHVDHIFPIARGGKHSSDNVCRACPRCNIRKKHRLLSELPEGWYL